MICKVLLRNFCNCCILKGSFRLFSGKLRYCKESPYLAGLQPTQNLSEIKQASLEKEEENYHFKKFLRTRDAASVDLLVQDLNREIAPQIDCTKCGNCCKSLMVNITQEETERISQQLGQNLKEFKAKYVETSLEGMMVLNTIPCHFLAGTSCSIYENRFTECREFPRLDQPNFSDRLFATLMHYGRCPIIFRVVEALKIQTGFFESAAENPDPR